jgi:hypothetical protein
MKGKKMIQDAHSRRDFVALLARLGSAPVLATESLAAEPGTGHNLPIYDLNLPPAVLADLEAFAQEVIADVRYLDELQLEGAGYAFMFVPR